MKVFSLKGKIRSKLYYFRKMKWFKMDYQKYDDFVKQMPRMIIENENNDISVYLEIIARLIGEKSNSYTEFN